MPSTNQQHRFTALPLQTFQSLYPKFQSEFDDLGPVEFSKKVISFGNWLSQNKLKDSPAGPAAKAQYAFLEDRLNFWLGYEYLPPEARGNLISASYILYRGAVLARITDSPVWPKSMNAVARAAMGYEGPNPARAMGRPAIREPSEELHIARPGPFSGVGGIADADEVKILWGRGIVDQGKPWEKYLARQFAQGCKL